MLKQISAVGWLGALLLVLTAVVLGKTKLEGDGHEYLLMTHALANHGSAEIRPSDVEHFLKLPDHETARLGVPRQIFQPLRQQLDQVKPRPVFGFYPNAEGKIYAIHYWLYSLLALPFYLLMTLLGGNPVWAFSLLNLAFAVSAILYLRRALPTQWPTASVLFLLMGATFYLSWTGPELMSASMLLVGCTAAWRGQLGGSLLAIGVAASQNPSIIFMMPVAFAYRIMLAKWPALSWPGARLGNLRRAEGFMAAGGILFALLPYAYFQFTFDTPSLTAKATDPNLIGAGRLFSLFFDVNQGMVAGVPGLLTAVVLTLPISFYLAPQKRLWAIHSLLIGAAVLMMAVPTLATVNWNHDAKVMLRYAVWLAMPLLALLLFWMSALPRHWVNRLAILAVSLQAFVILENGLFGEWSHYLSYNNRARWLLAHYPSLYNPEAEIFFERSSGQDGSFDARQPDTSVLYRDRGQPRKLLRQWAYPEASGGLCAADQILQGSKPRYVQGGWQYLHPPFDCLPREVGDRLGVWRINAKQPVTRKLLADGWSSLEASGVWSDGIRSILELPVPPGKRPQRLRLLGYYARLRSSIVTINGLTLGTFRLADGLVDLPSNLPRGGTLTVELQHPDAISSKSRGETPDSRLLGFYLKAIAIETAPE
jgi:hypothetical protein